MAEPIVSKTGVRIAADFRANLIVDRYDPGLAAMRGKKLNHLRSENSEDALTWNVFRSLLQISPVRWLGPFLTQALGSSAPIITDETAVRLWAEIPAPASIRLKPTAWACRTSRTGSVASVGGS